MLLVLLVAGCGGTQTVAQKARKEFLFKYPKLDDQQAAKLCPALYPSDFFTRNNANKHYHYTKDKAKKFVFTAAQQADAAKTPGCKGVGTKPK
jgi:hypothetical protein